MRTNDDTLELFSKQLDTIESLLRHLVHIRTPPRIVLTGFENDIVAVVGEKPLGATAIAGRMKCKCNSHFRATLSILVRVGVLEKTPKGYAPARGDVNRVICMKPASGHAIATDNAN